MNREIKFRVWDNTIHSFVSQDTLKEIFGLDLFNISQNSKKYTIQQFTGVLDKNGKEIFEGDLIKNNSHNNEICEIGYFTDIYASFGYRGIDCKGDFYHLHSYKSGKDFEVIGNIFENPELIKK